MGRTGCIADAVPARSCSCKGMYAADALPGSRSTGFSHRPRHPRLLNSLSRLALCDIDEMELGAPLTVFPQTLLVSSSRLPYVLRSF